MNSKYAWCDDGRVTVIIGGGGYDLSLSVSFARSNDQRSAMKRASDFKSGFFGGLWCRILQKHRALNCSNIMGFTHNVAMAMRTFERFLKATRKEFAWLSQYCHRNDTKKLPLASRVALLHVPVSSMF